MKPYQDTDLTVALAEKEDDAYLLLLVDKQMFTEKACRDVREEWEQMDEGDRVRPISARPFVPFVRWRIALDDPGRIEVGDARYGAVKTVTGVTCFRQLRNAGCGVYCQCGAN
jgi:hypothetical protein